MCTDSHSGRPRPAAAQAALVGLTADAAGENLPAGGAAAGFGAGSGAGAGARAWSASGQSADAGTPALVLVQARGQRGTRAPSCDAQPRRPGVRRDVAVAVEAGPVACTLRRVFDTVGLVFDMAADPGIGPAPVLAMVQATGTLRRAVAVAVFVGSVLELGPDQGVELKTIRR